MFEKTEKLIAARFRRQRVVVCEALASFDRPRTAEEIADKVEGAGYGKLLNDWAIEHGGIRASVRYHLRALNKLENYAPSERDGSPGSAIPNCARYGRERNGIQERGEVTLTFTQWMLVPTVLEAQPHGSDARDRTRNGQGTS
jgi:hypothetical protein